MCKCRNQRVYWITLSVLCLLIYVRILFDLQIYNDNVANIDNSTIKTMNILNRPKYKDYDMVILRLTPIWGVKKNMSLTTFCNISDTDKINQKILVTDDISLRRFANALIFHSPDFKPRKITRTINDDIYILHTRESPSNYKVTWHKNVLSNFNLLMSYRLDAEIPVPYLWLDSFKTFIFQKNIHSFKEKDNMSADVLWIGSNCNAFNGREKYLSELFKYVSVHSLGICLYFNPANVTIPPQSNYKHDISDVVSKYKFYMAIENSNCEGYITEKLIKPLKATTIPVVFSVNGIPEYHKILPAHSYINAADFDCAKDLAEYLNMIGSNEALYNSFFHFKSTESKRQYEWNKLRNIFESIGFNTTWCRAANVIYQVHRNKEYNKTVVLDDSCIERNIMAKYANASTK